MQKTQKMRREGRECRNGVIQKREERAQKMERISTQKRIQKTERIGRVRR